MNKNYIFIGIATVLAIYGILNVVAAPLANIFLSFAIIISAVLIGGYFLFRKQLFQLSMFLVPARYHAGINSIKNQSCTVSYFPGERIIVADNSAKNECNKRYFVVQKTSTDIDIVWFRTCRVFNRYSTLGLLAEFYRTYTPIDIKVEKDESKPKKRIVEKVEYQKPKTFVPKTTAKTPDIVDFDQLQTMNRAQATTKDEEAVGLEEFLSMGEVMQKSQGKVDINTATASEIAVLHGINIAIAKKIVEHRNLNGDFKSIEEFLEVAEVKEHFIPQIKELVTLSDTSAKASDNNQDGRELDF